jgi:hypothetical protein
MQNPSIHQLRRAGFKVRVHHKRDTFQVQKLSGNYNEFLSKGGYTRIDLTTPDGKTTTTGESICSKQDQYVRKTGNVIALGRAIAEMLKENPDSLNQFS